MQRIDAGSKRHYGHNIYIKYAYLISNKMSKEVVIILSNKSNLSEEIYSGIYKVSLPLPGKHPGPVNVYIFKGRETVLLDAGLNRHYAYLERALQEIGLSFNNIKKTILSHGHPDHYGAACRIKRHSSAKILIHEDDKITVETGKEVPAAKYLTFLRLMGVPIRMKICAAAVACMYQNMAGNCRVDYTLRDGDTLELGDYTGEVVHTPGHTRGSICIYLPRENILFSGDHVLRHISPNAFVMLESDSALPRRLSQIEYFNSLDKLERLNADIIWPGHGESIDNLNFISHVYRDQFRRRQDKISSILSSGDMSVYEIARRLFTHIPRVKLYWDIYLAISEVYTHLQVLERDKMLVSKNKEGVLLYSLSGQESNGF